MDVAAILYPFPYGNGRNPKKGWSMSWDNQDINPDAKVLVSGDYVRNQQRANAMRTDFLIIDETAPGGAEKTHLSIDQHGNPQVWGGNPDILGG